MRSTCLLVLASLTVCKVTLSGAQSLSTEDEADGGNVEDNSIIQRAEGLLLRSLLHKLQNEDTRNNGFPSQSEWVTKRQHPGKRYGEDLEKRQHPGRREEAEGDASVWLQRRQHPGKREDDLHSFLALQKRQHPGKRSTGMGQIPDDDILLFSPLSKRQHPGKRYSEVHSKQQHPGQRYPEDDEWQWAPEEGDDLPGMEKRQHPGKRFSDSSNPDLGQSDLCAGEDPAECSKTNVLLDFLDSMGPEHLEEKRQHPGKRFAPEEDLEEGE